LLPPPLLLLLSLPVALAAVAIAVIATVAIAPTGGHGAGGWLLLTVGHRPLGGTVQIYLHNTFLSKLFRL
jgi:hypothetical protein